MDFLSDIRMMARDLGGLRFFVETCSVFLFSDVNLIISLINGVNLPKMPLQLLSDIVDKAKVKQVGLLCFSLNTKE